MCTDFSDLKPIVNYFKFLLSTLLLRFVSKPVVSFRMYKHLSLVLKSKSRRKSFPVIMEGEGKLGMST